LPASIGLYAVGVAIGIMFFSPALRRQLAEAERDLASEAYAAAALRSNLLGVLTIAIFTLIVVLMVSKPF
jgi:hypothetical protein